MGDKENMTTAPAIHEGDLIEFEGRKAIVWGALRSDPAFLVSYDADGIRMVVTAAKVTLVTPRAEVKAGWAL